MSISIVIPNYNRAEALPLTLEALSRQTYPADQFEVIVVDQDSTDRSREIVFNTACSFNLRLLEQPSQSGPSIARNGGAEAAHFSNLLFLDSDIILEPDNLAQLETCRNQYPKALLCGIVRPYPPVYHSFLEKAANPEVEIYHGSETVALPFYMTFTNYISIPIDVFDQLGGFDIGLRAIEDIEFAYRAARAEFELLCCPKLIGYHNHLRSFKDRLDRARLYTSNLPAIYERYPEWRNSIPGYRDFDPIDWSNDSLRWIFRKLVTRLISREPFHTVFLKACLTLEKQEAFPRLARFLYWRLIQAYGYMGYKGIRNTFPS